MKPEISDRVLLPLACVGIAAIVISLILTPVAAHAARKWGAVAVPRERDSHDRPVPRWGGLALFLALLIPVGVAVLLEHSRIAPSTLIQGGGIIAGAAVITIVGLIDDLRELRALPRLVGQALASLLPFATGVRIHTLKLPFTAQVVNVHWLSGFITVFWMMLIMNAINWIDGLDGLAAGVCAIISVFLSIFAVYTHQFCLALLSAALAGSTIGFLRYNYSPARIFMGGGAELLGFILASVSVAGAFKQVATVTLIIPLLIMALPILDSVHVVVRRAATGVSIYQADQGHLHHRLVGMGLSKKQAVLVFYALTLALCVSAWGLASRYVPPGSRTPGSSHPHSHKSPAPHLTRGP